MTRVALETLSPKLGQAERDFVIAVVMKIVKNEAEADDVAQDALLLAFRHRDSFRGQSKYSTWLYRVAATTALMHLRSRARRRREISASQLGEHESSWIEAMESGAASPEAVVQSREELDLVDRIIDDLGSKYGEVLRLRWFQQCSEREVSRRLKLPLTTVKARAFRGRRHVLSECMIAA